MPTVIIEPFKIIGISIQTINENDQASKDIAALWGRFMEENTLTKIPNKIENDIYSLYTAYEGDHTQPYTTILGCKVDNLDEIPDGMIGRSYDGGKYYKISSKGDLMQRLIVKQWEKIFEMDLNRSYVADFEVYGEKSQNPSATEVDVYVGIKD